MAFKKTLTAVLLFIWFSVLVALGVWQLNRLEWKNDVISKIEAQETIDPMTVKIDFANPVDFQRGYVTGQFIKDVSPIHLHPRTYEGKVGYHILRPFMIADTKTPILVNMGWVENGVDGSTLPSPNAKKIAGYLRSPDEKGAFIPDNFSQDNRWYWLDIDALNNHYNMDFYPKILYLESPQSLMPLTFAGMPQPRNKHMQYAVFWFFMAGLLPLLVILAKKHLAFT